MVFEAEEKFSTYKYDATSGSLYTGGRWLRVPDFVRKEFQRAIDLAESHPGRKVLGSAGKS